MKSKILAPIVNLIRPPKALLKYHFIHIPKCGGTSCRDYLLEHLPDAVDSLAEPKGPLPIDSTPLRHVQQYTGRPLASWKLIVIPIRNPYTQVLSHWSYHRNRYAFGGRHVHDFTGASYPTLSAWMTDPHSDFRFWYVTQVRRESPATVENIGFYEYFATDLDGNVPPNVVFVRCEELSAKFPDVVAPYCKSRGDMPHKRSSPHKGNPLAYHSPMSMMFTEQRFAWCLRNDLYPRMSP